MTDFHGYSTRRLSSKLVQVDCLDTAGPRIVRLSYKGSDNLLAELPTASLPTPHGDYRILGGHRLWHAPEAMPRSYMPDGEGLKTTEVPGGLMLEGTTEKPTGIRKRIEVRLDPDEAKVTLTHTLVNEGSWEVELAPWAITMFRLGGTAILPTRSKDAPAEGLLPDRHLSLWPYTRLDDPRLRLNDGFVRVRPTANMPPLKIGSLSTEGWIVYWLDGILFRKSFDVFPRMPHPDYDCNAEIYCDNRFVELESLGPMSKLPAGGKAQHTETWELFEGMQQDFLTTEMVRQLSQGPA
ncbi:MAG: hypothetical protein ACK2T0_02950 [Anaerolineales bacterium]